MNLSLPFRPVLFATTLLAIAAPARAESVLREVGVATSPFTAVVNPVTNRIYVASSSDATVTVIDGATLNTEDVAVGATPKGLAVNPLTNKIYVANQGGTTVTVIYGASIGGVVHRTKPVNVGFNPTRLAINPVTNKIYVANTGGHSVTVIDGRGADPRVDPADVPIKTITFADNAILTAIAVNPVTNKIYVVDRNGNQVTVIDGVNDTILPAGTIAVGANPAALAVNPVTNRIYVANASGGSVTVINGATNAAADNVTIPVGGTPADVVVNPVTDKIYVANTAINAGTRLPAPLGIPTVTVIEGASNEIDPVEAGTQPIAVAVNPLTNKIYVADGTAAALTVIDGGTNQPSPLALGVNQQAVAVNPITDRIFVTTLSRNAVSVIDGASNGIVAVPAGTGPVAVAVNPVNHKAYVANTGGGASAGSVTVIDAATNTAIHLTAGVELPAGVEPRAVAVNPVTRRVYVACHAGDANGLVTVLDGAADQVIASVTVGKRPGALAVNPVTNRIYVANSSTDAQGVPTGAGSVSVLDGDAHTLLSITPNPIPVGSNPRAIAVNPVTNTIYVANAGSGSVSAIDGVTHVVVPIAVDGDPVALAVNPAINRIYAANNGLGADPAHVNVIDGATQTRIGKVSLEGTAQDVAINPVTHRIYAACSASTSSLVFAIDGATLEKQRVDLGGGANAGAFTVAVNPAADQIYVAHPLIASVVAIDGATNTLTNVPVPGANADPSAVAVNPVTNQVFVAIPRTSSVAILTPVPAGRSNLATFIERLPDDTTSASTTTFHLSAVSLYGPGRPGVEQIYYQLDSTQGEWRPAARSGLGADATLAGLPRGFHVLYAFAADAQAATSIQAGQGSSLIPGQVNAYPFLVGEALPFTGTFSAVSARVLAREDDAQITVLVQRDFREPATVEYRTVSGSALDGSDFVAASGTVLFGQGEVSKSITVRLRDDDFGEAVEIFTVELLNPSAGTRVADPGGSTSVILLDDDTPDGVLSRAATTPPQTPPTAGGSIAVTLSPPAADGRWRLFGELDWRASGATATGLASGDYGVEFQPRGGYVTPDFQVLPLAEDQAIPTAGIYRLVGPGSAKTGRVKVNILPATLAGRQWFLQGDPAPHASGDTVEKPIGAGTIEFAEIAGYVKPPKRIVELQASALTGQPLTVTVESIYTIRKNEPGTPVAALTSAEAAAAREFGPFQFIGQLATEEGFGTGFVPLDRTVLTCAHVVYDDRTMSAVPGVRWLFQHERDSFRTPPQIPRGAYLFTSYSEQRARDRSDPNILPGESSFETRVFDAAVLYFFEPAARGGAGGYLASDSRENNSWLIDQDPANRRRKILAGYPADDVPEGDAGTLHATPALPAAFQSVKDGVFRTTDLRSSGGNSGGPLLVEFAPGVFFPAAIYLGGTAQTEVRAIDSKVIDLLARGQVSANGGRDDNSGGVIAVESQLTAGEQLHFGGVKVTLLPAGAVAAGARWKLASREPRLSGQTLKDVFAGSYRVTFTTVPGYATPAPQDVAVLAGTSLTPASLTARYLPTSKPRITSALTAHTTEGRKFKYQILATFDPTSFSATPLPPGLTFNPATGLLTGTIPDQDPVLGPFTITLSATSSAGTTDAVLALTVAELGQLEVAVQGQGAVPPAFLGASPRDVGALLTIRARPAAGFLFQSWRNADAPPGEILNAPAMYRFPMPRRYRLVATFVPNLFLPAQGTYTGLLTGGTLGSAGRLKLTVNARGAFTGTLNLGGQAIALRSAFNAFGKYSGVLLLAGRKIAVDLTLTAEGALTGAIREVPGGATFPLAAARGAFSAKNPATQYAGAYTAVLPLAEPGEELPGGHGFGTLTITPAGVVKFSGFLGDGTPASTTAELDAEGRWPFFVAPGGKGLVVGTVFATGLAAPHGFTAALAWLRPADATDLFFPDGFTTQIALTAASYTPPALPNASSTLTLAGAGLGAPVLKDFTVAAGAITFDKSGPFTLRISRATGLFSGSFTGAFPGLLPARATRPFSGAILQGATPAGQGVFRNAEGGAGTVDLGTP